MVASRKSRRVPTELRKRTENSCDRCKTRKHKCHRSPGMDRCFHCMKYGYECVVTKPRKPRLPPAAAVAAAAAIATGELVDAYNARMEAMQDLLKGLVPEADVTSLEGLQRVGQELGIPLSNRLDTASNSTSTIQTDDTNNHRTHDVDTTSESQPPPPLLPPTWGLEVSPSSSTSELFESDLCRVPSRTPHPSSATTAVPSTTCFSVSHTSSSSAATTPVKSSCDESLVHDRQGQNQYIGRASSYYFQIRLQTLVGTGKSAKAGQMELFGPNPAYRKALLFRDHAEGIASSALPPRAGDFSADKLVGSVTENNESPTKQAHASLFPILETGDVIQRCIGRPPAEVFVTVRAFFDHVNVDFPVLHEATFLGEVEAWLQAPETTDCVWLCSLYCVLILGRRHTRNPDLNDRGKEADAEDDVNSHVSGKDIDDEFDRQSDEDELWLWSQIQLSLPTVLFTTCLASIQALMLASLHLHNTNSRDVCWTLTGAALRLGYAIGLHRSHINTAAVPPLAREMRKKIWWTLYAFEQLQVSSHDRPSAVGSPGHVADQPPRESVLGGLGGVHQLFPGYSDCSSRLTLLLGRVNAMPEAIRATYNGPLAPAVTILRDLARWRADLPAHLSVDALHYTPPCVQRATLLLHVQYHYVVCLVARHALLARYTALSQSEDRSSGRKNASLAGPSPFSVDAIADMCMASSREAVLLLLRLARLRHFNSRTGFDVYYLYSSALVLVLSLICDAAQRKHAAVAATRQLFHECASLAARCLRDPRAPGTMRRWLGIVGDLHAVVDQSGCGTEKHHEPPTTPTEQTSFSTELRLNGRQEPTPVLEPSTPQETQKGDVEQWTAVTIPATVPPRLTPDLTTEARTQQEVLRSASVDAATIITEQHAGHDIYNNMGGIGESAFIEPAALPPFVLEFFGATPIIDASYPTTTVDWGFDCSDAADNVYNESLMW
ncbi:Transcription factor [Niveomyces insectorum RCEF 264]|uniref:Transcription factor n=1 Tax=Niveomyces insectorum RCEF 264 TaxID=1081102 RepID=A0A162IAC8_9HYPO|nr:Transcription factor [Niveomyces insectorum RCEF 264]